MLAIPSAPTRGSRPHYRPNTGDAWHRRTPSVFNTSLDLKQQQLAAEYQHFETNTAMSSDTEQLEEALEHPSRSSKRGNLAAFHLVDFSDSDDEEDSDYTPSEDDEKEVREGDDAGALDSLQEEQTNTTESEEEEEDLDDYSRWWGSSEDKYKWEQRYKQADAAFRKRFGCGIDTPTHPETRRKLKKKKTRYHAYKYVLAGLVIANLVQLALVYSASSWAFSMVTWRSSTTENDALRGDDDTVAHTASKDHIAAVSRPLSVSEHVRTGLYLCSSLSRRVVKSEHDVAATQHALRACDIAVKFAPVSSREALEAHVLRGDLRSLLSLFDDADEDYNVAMNLVLDSNWNVKFLPELSQNLELKLVANHWTQLYKDKKFRELRREAKDKLAAGNTGNEVKTLAADWLSAFRRKISVLDVLTVQRGWTLHRLKYDTLENDKTKRHKS
ncbi:hypothetical protein GN244_ATG08218 [Phytophthora infestans]|uniref:Transmembrane protein n=1 Tax=Phytophthora infestans TaxID=4787 RepID=A0A833WVY6_PHYIN|nr:hypothetical protein GN244_ATG08218 [Phytophthora infestans]